MDKILSARVDEAIIQRIGRIAQELQTTKKAVIEAAILSYAETTRSKQCHDIFEETLGAWKRSESPGETVKEVRRAIQESMRRYQR